MAIVNFSFTRSDAPADAVGVRLNQLPSVYVDGNRQDAEGPMAYWVWKTHVGLCLRDREMNGYNDSDFFMTIWNPETKEPFEVMFASTRGWTYPSYGSSVDATPEVRAEYDAYLAAKQVAALKAFRKTRALKLRADRNAVRKVIGNGDSFVRAMRLRRAVGDDTFAVIVKLCGTKVRSEFKKSLQNQCLNWFRNGSEYRSPLSPKQLACLTRYEAR